LERGGLPPLSLEVIVYPIAETAIFLTCPKCGGLMHEERMVDLLSTEEWEVIARKCHHCATVIFPPTRVPEESIPE